MPPEKEERLFKGIKAMHVSIVIAALVLFISGLSFALKIVGKANEILTQIALTNERSINTDKQLQIQASENKANYIEAKAEISELKEKYGVLADRILTVKNR